MMQHYYYLFTDVLLVFILIITVTKDKSILKNWILTLPGMIFTSIILAMMDNRFLENGIISINDAYILGVTVWNIPIEQWLYYFLLSISSVFIFKTVKLNIDNKKPNIYLSISLILLLVAGIMTYVFRAHIYFFFILFLLTIYWAYIIFRNKFKHSLKAFFISFLVLLLPFLIFQGILTALPVVTYYNAHIIGYNIFSIPIESIFLLFLVLLINNTFYLYLKALKQQ